MIDRGALAAAGDALRAAGLTVRHLAAWAGHAHLPRHPRAEIGRSAILDMFVAGRTTVDGGPLADGTLATLIEARLVTRDSGHLVPRAAILPLGAGFVVCDRETWPDDSSYHLAAALPVEPIGRWLDLGCGSAFAAIARPKLAREAAGIELVAETARFAQLGAALSRRSFAVAIGDLATAHAWGGTCDLVSCNMPIPDGGDRPWRSTRVAVFERLWPAARSLLAPGGLCVVHAALGELHRAAAMLEGERVTVAYTPDDADGFGVLWWRPHGSPGDRRATRRLSAARPHLDAHDRDGPA